MTTYHKSRLTPPRCGHCDKPAKWLVQGGVTNYYVGQFCDEHADARIKAQEQYEAGLKRLSSES
jgi:hypothetical protein